MMSIRSRKLDSPKLTNSGTTSTPKEAATSDSRSAVESVTTATRKLRASCLYERGDETRDLADDVLVHLSRGDTYRVANCDAAAAAMGDDTISAQTEQRRTAVGFIVQRAFETRERAPRQQRAELYVGAAGKQCVADGGLQCNALGFRQLEHDVADETVGDEHVGTAGKDVASFRVADEINRGRFQKLRGF